MATAPFAALEHRVNSAVQARIANATATHQGGEPFGVIFDRAQTNAFGGGGAVADAAECTVSFDLAHAPGLAEGGELVIGGVVFVVGGGVQADSSGWVTGLAVYPRD